MKVVVTNITVATANLKDLVKRPGSLYDGETHAPVSIRHIFKVLENGHNDNCDKPLFVMRGSVMLSKMTEG